MIERIRGRRGGEVVLVFSLPCAFGTVFVVGDFNDWDPTSTPMVARGETLTASVTVTAGPPCRFRYVRGDGNYFNDENADRYVEHETGGYNSEVDTSTDSSRVDARG